MKLVANFNFGLSHQPLSKRGGMLPKSLSVNLRKSPFYRWLGSFRGMKNRSQEEVEILSSVCWENPVKWKTSKLRKIQIFSTKLKESPNPFAPLTSPIFVLVFSLPWLFDAPCQSKWHPRRVATPAHPGWNAVQQKPQTKMLKLLAKPKTGVVLLMDEILHHLVCIKPCK